MVRRTIARYGLLGGSFFPSDWARSTGFSPKHQSDGSNGEEVGEERWTREKRAAAESPILDESISRSNKMAITSTGCWTRFARRQQP